MAVASGSINFPVASSAERERETGKEITCFSVWLALVLNVLDGAHLERNLHGPCGYAGTEV